MPTLHRYASVCRPADVYRRSDADRALRAELAANAIAYATLAAGCRAVAELRTIPVLYVSDRPDSPLGYWAPLTWEYRPVWLRAMFAECDEPRCRALSPEGQKAAREAAYAAASPHLRNLRRAAGRRRVNRAAAR